MTETPSKIIPNSFQSPNFFVDECMALLTGNEYKCLTILARKTFGWQKRSDRVSKSQIAALTGIGLETVDAAMNALTEFGLVLRLAENNLRNDGVEWALQTDDSLVRFDLMRARQATHEQRDRQKTEKARQTRIEKGVGMSNIPTSEKPSVEQKPVGGGDVQQPPQKPIKDTNKKSMGADAPARAADKTPEQRIADFPADCREGANLMLTVFGIKAPLRPAPSDKGGVFALWIKGIRELTALADDYGVPLETAMRLTFRRWSADPFNLSHPGALAKTMTGVLAAAGQHTSAPASAQTALQSTLETFKPRS